MGHFKRFMPRAITAQIAALVTVAVLIGVLLTFGTVFLLMEGPTGRMNPRLKAASEAARIATIVRDAEAPRNKLADVLTTAQSPGGNVEVLLLSQLTDRLGPRSDRNNFARSVLGDLQSDWGIETIEDKIASGWTNAIIVKLSDDRVLVFQNSQYQVAQTFLMIQIGVVLSIVLVATLAVSAYAIRWVIRPLSQFAAAAHSFGRSAGIDRELKVDGPREIAQVAQALNDMMKRVRSLVDERTRMLAAISHDLRTPLTRLRLRSERVVDESQRRLMLNDVATIDAMIGETLSYLRDSSSSEPAVPVDLPSLLQTICAEFSDTGHDVAYVGPDRLAFVCRQRALTRAVTNVVENGVKHGTKVIVAIDVPDPGILSIEISDDGPGIPTELLEKVFEPFFRADPARFRSGAKNFGLGLSIARDIIEGHGGSISLFNPLSGGLTVRISLKRAMDVWQVVETTRVAGLDRTANQFILQ
jgi:signal transduction histidine kinase